MKSRLSLALPAAICACVVYPPQDATHLYACLSDSDCATGLTCLPFLDAGNHCQAPSDGGVDAGFDAGADAGGDAGLDAGFDAGEDAGPWSTDGGMATVAVPKIGGGPVNAIASIDAGFGTGLDLVLGSSLWVASGSNQAPSWSDTVANSLYDAAIADAGNTSFHILQIAATSRAWFAQVYQGSTINLTAAPHVVYVTLDEGGTWSPIGAYASLGLMAAIDDYSSLGPLLFLAVTNSDDAGSLTDIEVLQVDGGLIGTADRLDPQHAWNELTAMVPFAAGGGVLVDRKLNGGEIDLVTLDGGGGVGATVVQNLTGLTLAGGVVGPLVNLLRNDGAVLISFPLTGSAGDDEVWQCQWVPDGGDGGPPSLLTSFGIDAGAFAFATRDEAPAMWFADQGQLIAASPIMTYPEASDPGGPLGLLGAFGRSMWGLTDFDLDDLTELGVDGGAPVAVDSEFYGQILANFRSTSDGQAAIAIGGSNSAAPVLYEATSATLAQLTGLSYPGCLGGMPLDPGDVLLNCPNGTYLTWTDAGTDAGLALLTGDAGTIVVMPAADAGGPRTFFLHNGAGNPVEAFTLKLSPPTAVPLPLPGVLGPVFPGHSSNNPLVYAYSDATNALVQITASGSITPVGQLPPDAGLSGAVDPNDDSRFDVVLYPHTGSRTLSECQTVDGGVVCQSLCSLPSDQATEFRFAPSGDLWAISSPLNVGPADVGTVGDAHLFHISAAARQLAGQLQPLPDCPEITLEWSSSQRPEGFSDFGVVGSAIYLTGSRHTLAVTLQP